MTPSPRKAYLASLATLVGGAGATQLIPLATAPILTRLYSPSAFAALAMLTALGAIWGAVASGRIHMAILIPTSNDEARRVVSLSFIIIGWSSTILLAALIMAEVATPGKSLVGLLGPWIFAVPFIGATLSLQSTLTTTALRYGSMSAIAKSTVARAVASNGTQLALGALAVPSGLLTGSTLGAMAGNFRLYLSLRTALPAVRLKGHVRRLLIRYSRFVTLDTPGSLLNALAANLIVLAIAHVYSADELGQYALAQRVLVLPSAVVGTAIGQIFAQRFASLLRAKDGVGALGEYRRTTLFLFAISICGYTPFIFAGRPIFTFAFGHEWDHAGQIAVVLAPLLIVRFVVSPLTSVFTLRERQGTLLMIQILLAGGTTGALLAAVLGSWDLMTMLRVQVAAFACVYVWTWFAGQRLVRGSDTKKLCEAGAVDGLAVTIGEESTDAKKTSENN